MNDFDAKQARKIVDELFTNELHNILIDIKTNAEKGETVLHIYKPLKGKTVDDLANRGFKIIVAPSIATQKDNLYYSINW